MSIQTFKIAIDAKNDEEVGWPPFKNKKDVIIDGRIVGNDGFNYRLLGVGEMDESLFHILYDSLHDR